MNILIVGANGGIGRQSVEQALIAGHKTTAMVRNPATLTLTHPLLDIVQGDIMQPKTFERYLYGQDVVISALGVSGSSPLNDKPTTLYSEGNAHLIGAMKKTGVVRAFFISASAIETSPVLPFYARWATKVLQRLLRNMYADQRLMEDMVKASGIEYTIIRPPRLTDKPATGSYRVSINGFLKNSLTISRADVAHFMIHHLDDQATYQALVEIGY
jgi:putative NADH-flavin reductase